MINDAYKEIKNSVRKELLEFSFINIISSPQNLKKQVDGE